MSSVLREYLTQERLRELPSLVGEYKWYITATLAAGYVLLKVINRPRNLPPGPRGWPVIGAVTELSDTIHLDAMRIGKKYNSDIVSVNVFGTLMIFLNTRELLHETLIKRSEEFSHRPPLNDENFQDEIFCAPYNEQWKANKKFTMSTLRSHGYGTRAGEGILIAAFEYMHSAIARNGYGKVMDLLPVCQKAAGCMIYNILIGNNFDLDDEGFLEFFNGYTDFSEVLYDKRMMMAFVLGEKVSRIVLRSYMEKKDRHTKAYSMIIQEVVKEAVRTYDPDNPRNVIDGFIQARGPENINPKTMASNLLIFTGDAIDTFSSTFCSMFFYLAKYQNVQALIQDQLDKVVGSGRLVNLDDKKSLPLVDAAIYETLRIVTPFPATAPREIKTETTLKGYTLPVGAHVFSNIWAVHNNEKVYPSPNKFNIENFLDQDGTFHAGDFWMPFSTGRRMCMGESLVKMQFFILLANFLSKFKVSFPDGYIIPEDDDLYHNGLARCSPKYEPVFTER